MIRPPLSTKARSLPELSKPSADSIWSVTRQLMPYLWPQDQGLRLRVLGAVLCLIIAKAANLSVPLLYKQAVDALSVSQPAIVVVPVALIAGYGLVRLLSSLFNELRDWVFSRVEQYAMRRMGLQVFNHLHSLSMRYHLGRKTGGVTRGMGRGTRAIEVILYALFFTLIPTLVEIALVMGILWHLFGVSYALVILLTIVVYLGWTFTVTEWRTRFYRAMNEAENDTNTRAIDSLLNYETVKYFGNEALEARRYDEALTRYQEAAIISQGSMSLLNVGQALIISAGLITLMIKAAQGIAAGQMTVGDFVLVNTYLLQLYQPLNVFGMLYRQIRQAVTDMDKIFELLQEKRDVADLPDAPTLQVQGGEVRFDQVYFGYDPRRPILQGVSFTIPAGRTLAVVGQSGAGKSTLSRLLFRFYDIEQGCILIDGQNIRQVTQASVRQAIGIVPQDTVLFNDTIYYNIAYGRPGATREEVEQAARLAHIHPFIMAMPDGYDTVVGERGLKLSGGEKQRVAIARTILKDPAILVFDEATSALDSHSEREIQANLREVSQGRTTLIIAHRLSTIIDADQILVMQAGEVVEQGTHSELLQRRGLYFQMWQRQQGEAAERMPQTATDLQPDTADPGLLP